MILSSKIWEWRKQQKAGGVLVICVIMQNVIHVLFKICKWINKANLMEAKYATKNTNETFQSD